jgi:hypothetical protein
LFLEATVAPNLQVKAQIEQAAVAAATGGDGSMLRKVIEMLARIALKPQAGPIVAYYADLSSGILAPENMRIEDLTFRVKINPAGEITFQTDAIQIISQYNFALRRLVAWNMNPLIMGNAPGLVSFNVKEQGRNFTVFKTPVSMASVSAAGGAGNPAEFDGTYIAIPGTQLAVEWTVNAPLWASLVGTTKEMGVQLIGDYVICRGIG